MAAPTEQPDQQPWDQQQQQQQQQQQPSTEVRKLWKEVANGIDKSQTVVWKNAVESLQAANIHLSTSPEEARVFTETYMKQIIGILVEQQPAKIGQHEKSCVEESLGLGVAIVCQDLKLLLRKQRQQPQSDLSSSKVLDALGLIFNRKKAYYKTAKNAAATAAQWNHHHHHHHHHHHLSSGLPEVRIKMMDKFRLDGGYRDLAMYLKQRFGTPKLMPSFDFLHIVLWGLGDLVYQQGRQQQQQQNQQQQQQQEAEKGATTVEEAAILVSQAVMEYMNSFTDEMLRGSTTSSSTTNNNSGNNSNTAGGSNSSGSSLDSIMMVRADMQRIYDKLIVTRRAHTYGYYQFWRALILKLIHSASLPLRLTGWEQVKALIEASLDHRPPPKNYIVEGAGTSFVNGIYSFGSTTTPDGYMQRGTELTYKRHVPPGQAMEHEKDSRGGGSGAQNQEKILTLFRCTMRSQQKWWFLSDADEEQPGTDRDIDYYQHKSKERDEAQPPPSGWTTCRHSGQEPPPTLRPKGLMVPKGQEYQTLEHQLARWALENKIIEHVFGASLHREVVARSTPLIEFLATMCERDEDPRKNSSNSEQTSTLQPPGPNAYCLLTSHLFLAWRMCTSKADGAVSEEIYQLLVSILPTLPTSLAVPLLQTMFTSAQKSLTEVADFLSALANHQTSGGVPKLAKEKRSEILKLLWAVLTHPDASSLKNEDRLKRFVAMELKEPNGQGHREKFLESCTKWLASNSTTHSSSSSASTSVDEVLSLRIVKLTQFVLEACPRDQAQRIVTANRGELASLLFNELMAFLGRAARRRKQQQQLGERGSRSISFRNFSSAGSVTSEGSPSSSSKPKKGGAVNLETHVDGLKERLKILRYIYGVSEDVKLSIVQLQHLWSLGSSPRDREEVMVFVARAAQASGGAAATSSATTAATTTRLAPSTGLDAATAASEPGLYAAFSETVRTDAFLELFCSRSVSWEDFGASAYESFQIMFRTLRQSPGSSLASNGPSMDALWRICLTAGNESVVAQAMKDLLNVYIAMASVLKNSQTTSFASVAGGGSGASGGAEPMQTDDVEDENFGQRVFDCLKEVKRGLEAGDRASERSAERCLRILNAAVGQDGSGGRSITASTVASLSALPPNASLAEVLRLLPHGMRGQACYRRVGVMAKRTPQQQQQQQSIVSDASSATGRQSSGSMRFSLDVHPLETLASVKAKVARHCDCKPSSVKPISVSGRQTSSRGSGVADSSQLSLNVVPEDSTVDQLGIVQGCEMVFVIAPERAGQGANSPSASNKGHRGRSTVLDLSEIFSDPRNDFASKLFKLLLSVLEALPWERGVHTTHKLVWDLLLAMPTNAGVADKVRSTAGGVVKARQQTNGADAMSVDTADGWDALISHSSFQRSVYIMQTVDAFLQPAPEVLSILPSASDFDKAMKSGASSFRRGFVESGGFDAVIRFFGSTTPTASASNQSRHRMANAAALRILKCCMFGSKITSSDGSSSSSSSSSSGGLDDIGSRLLGSLANAEGLMQNLTAMVVGDEGISGTAVTDVLKFLRLLFRSQPTSEVFVKLPDRMAQKFVVTLLLWEGGNSNNNFVVVRTSSAVATSAKVRKNMHDLILTIPLLARYAMPWLINAIDQVDVNSDSTAEYFDVLIKLVTQDEEMKADVNSIKPTPAELQALGNAVCNKLLSCPRPSSGPLSDISTGVLCGCLKLLRALIENGGGKVLSQGTGRLIKELELTRWSDTVGSKGSVLGMVSSSLRFSSDDSVLVDLMGALFDGFLSPTGVSSVSICCDKESRQYGFDAVAAAARSCRGSEGYMALVSKVNGVVASAAPGLRHKWGQLGGTDDGSGSTSTSRSTMRNPSKYSGLRNQGCTCYMNSFLQQIFMMPELRNKMCLAPLPSSLRTSGASIEAKSQDLVGKKIALQWDTGVSFDAMVEGFDETTGMHRIRYLPIQIGTVGGAGQQHIQPEDIARVPTELSDEFILSEGRPGRETGAYEIVKGTGTGESTGEGEPMDKDGDEDNDDKKIEETEEEAAARKLLEEVQRTFIHLDEGSRGRCFDPRALVEACACLKLEFDVWQQNDASEFAMKLLDRMEIALKRWAPSHQEYMDHTFGLKQTKQKICKECGLKTNREENLMSIDCQIRGKTDIHEALETMCEVEYMEGNNKVFCDRCKKNTDTVLKTAISALPDVLILSLKRFDLDYNTFETVKLNSRLAFGQTLNMQRYTLEGIDAAEKKAAAMSDDPAPMDTDENEPKVSADIDYEYKLVGVLVHAGVAQGGHYYSFIKDRSKNADGVEEDKWYRFDDEDVTPFDSASIETECFGGKVKKETKLASGQVHTVESEQFANALMLFYEKVTPAVRKKPKPTKPSKEKKDKAEKEEEKKKAAEEEAKAAARARRMEADKRVPKSSGYQAFEPDVRKSNTTHRWQTFLFDTEFQTFLKGLLGLCLMSRKDRSDASAVSAPKPSWQGMIVDMLVTFFLDVYMYSADKSALQSWVMMLSETLATDKESARRFVHKLAFKTKKISSNWLRTFLADCPEAETRAGAARVFGTALLSCMANEQEQAALSRWSIAVREQYGSMRQSIGKVPLPTSLTGKWRLHEDLHLIEKGDKKSEASCVGVIISFLTLLIEVGPRTWKYNEDLCSLIRDMCNSTEASGALIRSAMNEAQVPARLIALMLREKSPNELRHSFPGASVAHEVIKTQIRNETNPNAHLLPLSGNQMMDTEKTPSSENYLSLIEALGRILGMKCMVLAPLVVVSNEYARRQTVVLTPAASDALTDIYNDHVPLHAHGMGQREIDVYLRQCNLDQRSIPTQKIGEIMAKYPAKDPNGNRMANVLSLEGFLAYYADVCQTHPSRVRSELHSFGFRPDLTRRAHDARFMTNDGQLKFRTLSESVGIDVATLLAKDGKPTMNELTLIGLDSLDLYVAANETMPELSDYLLASTAYERKTHDLINYALRALRRARNGHFYPDMVVSTSQSVLKGLASIPDGYQQERISTIMQGGENVTSPGDKGEGLLRVAKSIYDARANQSYTGEFQYMYERYLDTIKELSKLRAIHMWMATNRNAWAWMERDLVQSEEQAARQSRSDYGGRRDRGGYDNTRSSDTDMNGIHDSEEDDDDDSRLYDDSRRLPERVVVQNAGLQIVNGVYVRDGAFDHAGKYVKNGSWNGAQEVFSLFRCNVSNNTKHWYISIVPPGVQPGTNKDIDFYSAPMSPSEQEIPPTMGWMKANEGVLPAPRITVQQGDDENEVDNRGGWSGSSSGGGNSNPSGGGRYI